jgi:hypothetical protein
VSGHAARDGAQVAEGGHVAGLVGGPELGVVEEDRGSSTSGAGTDGGGRREMM